MIRFTFLILHFNLSVDLIFVHPVFLLKFVDLVLQLLDLPQSPFPSRIQFILVVHLICYILYRFLTSPARSLNSSQTSSSEGKSDL